MQRTRSAFARLMMAGAVLAATPCVALPAAALAAPRAATVAAADEVQVYTVRRGDTLIDLARRYMRTATDWKTVRTLNRVRDPWHLIPGTRLRVPLNLLKAEPLAARIASYRGAVRLLRDGRAVPTAVGAAVMPGTVVETGAGGFVSLRLSNGSHVALPSQSRVRIAAMRRILLTDSLDFDFAIEKGRVETHATPLPTAQSRYRIRTPIAVSAVRGTTFRVHYAEDGTASLTEVLEGTVGVGPDAQTLTPVPHGFGAAVAPDGTTRSAALLPPPVLADAGRVRMDPLVDLHLNPVAAAQGYRIQLARDAGFMETEREDSSATPDFRLADVADGRWFVRVTALAANGLEGLPQTYALRRKLAGVAASAEKSDEGYRFRWSGEGGGTRLYRFRLRPATAGTAPMIDETGLTGDGITLSDLRPGTYFWQVGVRQYDADGETVNWTPEQSLIVAPPEPAARP